jgi:putative transposase
LVEHCRHARFVWNLAVEQQLHWQPGRQAPGYNEQSAQLTAARAEYNWLAAGSQTVQQQALRDFAQAMRNFFHGTHRRPTWRKAGTHEGFRQVGLKPHHIKRLNRRYGQVWIPKVGWVKFRWTVTVALSNGELLHAPGLRAGETKRLRRLQQRLARARRRSRRRARTKLTIARLRARETDRRRDWVEKTTTDVARGFCTICVEDLRVRAITRSARGTLEHPGSNVAQKRGLNREISRQGWGLLVARLQHKAPGRVQFVPAAYTSQRCSHCGHVAPENRKSQAVFQCVACNAGPCNADVNAARNIAAGRAVTARGDLGTSRSANREPQLCSPAA